MQTDQSDQEDDFRAGWSEEARDSEGGGDASDAPNDDVVDEEDVADDDDYVLDAAYMDESASEEQEGSDASDSAEEEAALEPSDQEEPDDEPGDLFESTADAEQLLQGMSERQIEGPSETLQPYQFMGMQRKRARAQDEAQTEQLQGQAAPRRPSRRPASAVFGADVDADLEDAELAEKMNLGPMKGKARRMRAREKRRAKNAAAGKRTKLVPEEATRKMGEATLAYATHRYPEAMTLLWEVIRLAPNMPEAYHTLGALHENAHEPLKAINFYMIAAHLDPKDVGLWKRLAAMSTELDPPYHRQALYCLNRVTIRDKDDMDAKWDHAMLLSRINEPRKAIQALEQIAEQIPGDGEAAKMLARLHHRLGDSDSAMSVLQDLLANYPESADLTHVNMLSELLIRNAQSRQVLDLIRGAAATLCADDGLPIELQAKAGVCAAQLGDLSLARQYLSGLASANAAEMPDLILESADMLVDAGYSEMALPLYQQALSNGQLNTPDLWTKLSRCYSAVGDAEGGKALYRQIRSDESIRPSDRCTASMALADLLTGEQERDEALEVLEAMTDLLDPQWEAEEPQAAMALTMQRAHLFRKLGREEEYTQLMLPLVNSTLDDLEAPACSPAPAAGRKPRAAPQKSGPASRQRTTPTPEPTQPTEGDTLIKGFPARKPRRAQQKGKKASAASGSLPEAMPAQPQPADMAAEMPDLSVDGQQAAGHPLAAAVPSWNDDDDQPAAEYPPSKVKRKAGKRGKASDREGRAALGNAGHDAAQFEAVVRTARALLGEGRVQEAIQLARRSMAAFQRKERSRNDALELVLAAAALAEKDADSAMQASVRMIKRWPSDRVVWNCLSRAAAARGNFPTKVVSAIRASHPQSLPAALLLGSAHSLAGQHSAALEQLHQATMLARNEPLPRLLLGVAHATAAMSRKIPDRDHAVLLAFTYLQEYARLRGNEQEAAYNMGRAAHQLGLLHLAVPLYERALEAQPVSASSGIALNANRSPAGHSSTNPLNLQWEAAHNLVLVLRASGADQLAAVVMRQHLTV